MNRQMENRKKLIELIAQDRIREVFEIINKNELDQFTRKEQRTLTNLSARYYGLVQQQQDNVIAEDAAGRELSRIRLALLDVLTKKQAQQNDKKWRPAWMWGVVGLMVFLAIGFGLYTLWEWNMGPLPAITVNLTDEEEVPFEDTSALTVEQIDSLPRSNTESNNQETIKSVPDEETGTPKTGTGAASSPTVRSDTKSSIQKNKDLPLTLELRTNKGEKVVHVTSKDVLRLEVKTNQDSYIRIIYSLVGGEKILLTNDLHISGDKVDRFIEIGDGFIPDEPYGKETLYVIASTGKFPPLKTEIENGYEIIKEGLPEALAKSKGLRANVKNAAEELEVNTRE